MRRTCFFHAGCPDGFGAAWSVWRAWGDEGRYVPLGHDDALNPSAYEGQQLVFVDIAPGNESLRALGEVASQLVLLDHHLSAREAYAADPSVENSLVRQGHRIHFDLEHSGAVLAWSHFHPGEAAPDLLLYVEDQDLWTWKLPRSEEVNAAIGSYPREFEVWRELAARPTEELAEEGVPILRANRREVERALVWAHPVQVGGLRLEGVNAQHPRSAIGHELAKRGAYGHPAGVVYRVTDHRVDVSIYSIGDLDVSRIAARHGGGGHRNAAGFSVPLDEWTRSFV